MVSGSFCLCKVPLDLEDDQLALYDEALAHALDDLYHQGWNSNSAVGRAS